MRFYWGLLIVALILMSGCTPAVDTSTLSTPAATDSIVVENLITQSEKQFAANPNPIDVYDQFLKDAETIALKNDFQEALIRIYTIAGKRFRNKSNYINALAYHKKALDIAVNSNNKKQLADCYNMVGVVYRRIDENSLALDMHLKAMNYAEEVGDTFNISVSLNGIGNVNLSLERYQAAIEYFKKSMAISRRTNKLGQAINQNNIGEAYLKSGLYDTALIYFNRSLEMNRQINSIVGQSICFNSIGDTYIAKNEPQKALSFLLKALTLTRETGDLIYVAVSLTRVGETYFQLHDFDNAAKYLIEGYELSRRIGSRYQAQDAAEHLAYLHEAQGDYKVALKYFKIRSLYKDTLINEKNIYHVTTLETVFETEKQHNKINELNQRAAEQNLKISKQKTFISVILLVVLLIGVLLFLAIRQSQLKTKYNNLKHQQKLLRTQMNPHFIFNALSAIQVYILENDMERSSRFLADFAKLMRQVLRNSNYDYITLREEIDTLNYYIELQRLRFANPFHYNVEIDAGITPENMMIPPMLAQPFLENAIEHGLRPLVGEGTITLRFKKKGQNMVVEVEDNGIGIDQTVKNKDNSHESMALKITLERLDIIKKDTGKPVFFEIIDRHFIDPNESGTRVRIEFPIKLYVKQTERLV